MNASNKEKNNIEKNCWNMFDVPVCSPFKYYNLFKAFNMMPASKSAVTISNDEFPSLSCTAQNTWNSKNFFD